MSMGGANTILLVSKLPTDKPVTADMLFTLFGVYGDVVRVKIFLQQERFCVSSIHNTSTGRCGKRLFTRSRFSWLQHLHH
jgi:hypothetical protein